MKPCGTYAAHNRHLRNGEDPCDDCREAKRAYNTRMTRERRHRQGVNQPRKRPRCGTYAGEQYHRRYGEDICEACREARREYVNAWKRGKSVSRINERTTSADLILDVLETYGYAMTSDVLVSHVLDIKPGWKEPTVKRALFRMVDDGRVRQFERLGEWLYGLNE